LLFALVGDDHFEFLIEVNRVVALAALHLSALG